MLFVSRHLHWTANDWKKVLFSDESKFNIFGSDSAQFIHRPANKKLDPRYVSETLKHDGGNIMVWG